MGEFNKFVLGLTVGASIVTITGYNLPMLKNLLASELRQFLVTEVCPTLVPAPKPPNTEKKRLNKPKLVPQQSCGGSDINNSAKTSDQPSAGDKSGNTQPSSLEPSNNGDKTFHPEQCISQPPIAGYARVIPHSFSPSPQKAYDLQESLGSPGQTCGPVLPSSPVDLNH
jgi:hypothetical protein